MLEIAWQGGSESDRAAIAEQHDAYLLANAEFNWDKLEKVFSDAPWATYFNLNGHVYEGKEHWIRLWKYYITQQSIGYWQPFKLQGIISGDLAVVWCLRNTKSDWFGKDDPMIKGENAQEFISRSTMTFVREEKGWRCAHVHFSESRVGEPRPGDI